MRLSPKIGSGDFATKMHRAIEFLEDGDRIKVTVRFRGRELSHPELGRMLLERFAKQVEEHVIERMPVLEGKSMFIVMASTHKPKVVETPHRPGRTDEEGAPATGPARTPAAAAVPAATKPKQRLRQLRRQRQPRRHKRNRPPKGASRRTGAGTEIEDEGDTSAEPARQPTAPATPAKGD